LDESHIVIVPDRYTLCVEKLLCESLPVKGSFNISLLTFTRLASKMFSVKHISRSGAIMLVRKAAAAVKDNLTCYGKSSLYEGFAKSIYGEICRYREINVSPEELLAFAAEETPETAVRLKDIALIYKKYEELTQGRYTDKEGCLKLIAEGCQKSLLIKNSCFYIAGFDYFSKAEKDCLRSVAENSLKCCFAAAEGESFDYAKEILLHAKKDFEVFNLPCMRKEPVNFIYGNIDGWKSVRFNGGHNFAACAMTDENAETENAAQKIITAISEEGLRFKDICVVLTSIEKYLYSLDKIFKAYGIPYYLSESGLLRDEPVFKALYNLFRAAGENCPSDAVTAFVKSEFFGEDKKNTDIFENYCLKYGIDRSRYLKPFTLAEESDNPEIAENVRKRFFSFYSLIPPKEALCSELVETAKKIIRLFDIENRLLRQIDFLKSYGYADEAAYRAQALSKITKLLDEIEEIGWGEVITVNEFYRLLYCGAENIRLSVIPLSADAVNIGGIDLPRYLNSKKIFILGAGEGSFPITNFPLPILPYGEMKCAGRLEFADAKKQLRRERERIKQLLCSECQYIISYHMTENGKEIKASNYFEKLKNMFSLSVENKLKYKLKETKHKATAPGGFTCAKELFFSGGKASVSALETYFDCPRKFLYRYGYFAFPRKDSTLKSLDKGIFLHAAAELFVKKYKRNTSFAEIAQECFDIVSDRAEYRRFLSDTLQTAQLQRLKREIIRVCGALAKQIDMSLFEPKYIETKFGGDGNFPPIELCNGIFLTGKIDRADVTEEGYIRIIDYKSGDSKYSEKKLYFGNKVQLFIYMHALEAQGFIPAGVYYFPICDKYAEEGDNIYLLDGLTVNEDSVLRASDREIDSGESAVLKIKLKRDENGYQNNGNLISRDSFEKRVKYAVMVCKKAAEEIRDGNISVSPAKDVCTSCDYKAVCAFDASNAAVRKLNLKNAAKTIEEATDE
jgi:ATP-dependent helicase/nuclease subunit B